VSNGRITDELERILYVSGHCVVEALSIIYWKGLRKFTETLRTADVLAGIHTDYLPNVSLETYRYASPLGVTDSAILSFRIYHILLQAHV
jgi:hypothetical protein